MTDFDWITLEDAVITALTSQLRGQVGTLISYQGDWRADLQGEGWRLPAVLVRLAGTRSEAVGPRSYDLSLDVTLLVVVRQLRGEAAGRREVGGAYAILAGLRQALWHRDLGLKIQPLALVQEEPLLNNREFTVYEARYRTATVVDM